ncbi:hypothetical protein BDV98DRAFT_607504 [Pterulicium gracile]|uniref:Feruloyl esterase n=1 Tax=Pterulicium gracile TaxID=1884261 RepID=A0A5C3Q650_9AGAR|nr:hypothetical protein BDV98DRAFT_607504 [Pterula gracilis]
MERPCDAESVVIEYIPGREKVPLLQIHGGADATIAYDGGPRRDECLPSIPHDVRTWAGLNNISATSNVSEPLTDNATGYQFGDGEEEGLVTHVYAGDEVGHSWPATIGNPDNGRNGDGPASFNASSVILEFFGEWYGRAQNDTETEYLEC